MKTLSAKLKWYTGEIDRQRKKLEAEIESRKDLEALLGLGRPL